MTKLNLLEINPFFGKKLIIDFLKKRISFILCFLKIFLYSSNSPTEFIMKHLKFVCELRAIAELITALAVPILPKNGHQNIIFFIFYLGF